MGHSGSPCARKGTNDRQHTEVEAQGRRRGGDEGRSGTHFITFGPRIHNSPSPVDESSPSEFTSRADTLGIRRPIEPGWARASES